MTTQTDNRSQQYGNNRDSEFIERVVYTRRISKVVKGG